MERYLDVVLPALRAGGDTVEVIARTVTAVDAPATRELRWSDEHAPPSETAACDVGRTIEALRPDAVVMHNVLDAAVVEAARRAPRMIYQLHDHRPFCPNGDRVYPRTQRRCATPLGAGCLAHSLLDGCMYGPRPSSIALLRRRERLRDAIAAADVVIANSPFVAERAARSGVRGATALALPLPDDAYGTAPPPRDETLVFVGRLQPQKGLRSLIRALGRVPAERRALLRIVGDGPDRAACVAEAARRMVRVELLGRLDADGVRRAIDDAAALVLPSLWDEPFGYVGIEAFARRRPVIAYDVGGIGSWLRDGCNGILVRAGDEAALAGALARIFAQAAELGAAARADAERFRAAPIVAALRAHYLPA